MASRFGKFFGQTAPYRCFEKSVIVGIRVEASLRDVI